MSEKSEWTLKNDALDVLDVADQNYEGSLVDAVQSLRLRKETDITLEKGINPTGKLTDITIARKYYDLAPEKAKELGIARP